MGYRTSHTDSRRGRLRSSESLAGWVFADLLLVLFLVGLGTAIPVDPPEPPPKPVVKPEPEIIGMKTDPVKINVVVDADALQAGVRRAENNARDLIRRSGRELVSTGDRAALVLIFGGGETAGVGQQVAEAIYPQLNRASADVFPRRTPSRYFWDGGLPYGTVRLEVFVFTTKKDADAP